MTTRDPDRQQRLAEQLRANLRRRKAHARQVPAEAPAAPARNDAGDALATESDA